MRPLDGVRVLDLTRLLPGAYATLLLADLGADVVKIEDPRGGDGMRTLPTRLRRFGEAGSAFFERLNRNKRSVTLDLRSPDAAAVLDALAARSDVIVDVSIHGAATQWSMFPTTADLASACYTMYETADGQWLALGALEPKFWRGFCERIGRPDLITHQFAGGDEGARVLRDVRAIMRS